MEAKGDLKHQLESAFVSGLAEHTGDWRCRPFSDSVRAAAALLEAERRPRGAEQTR